MTDTSNIFMYAAAFLLIFSAIATWVIKTARDLITDVQRTLQLYKEAKADKKITVAEKDEIIASIELTMSNLGNNARKILVAAEKALPVN